MYTVTMAKTPTIVVPSCDITIGGLAEVGGQGSKCISKKVRDDVEIRKQK